MKNKGFIPCKCTKLTSKKEKNIINVFWYILPRAKTSCWSYQDVQKEGCEFSGGECEDPGNRHSSAHMLHIPGNELENMI